MENADGLGDIFREKRSDLSNIEEDKIAIFAGCLNMWSERGERVEDDPSVTGKMLEESIVTRMGQVGWVCKERLET